MSAKFNTTATQLAARLRSGEGPGNREGVVQELEVQDPRMEPSLRTVSAWALPTISSVEASAPSPQLLASSPSSTPWYTPYGLHAAANAVNAQIPADAAELEAIFSLQFNDSTTLCSWSNFNQFWILQALGNMGKMDYALASIRLCWGPMTTLGKGCFWELFSPEWTK
jgi:hypothetical protein